MDTELVVAQSLRYAEGIRDLYEAERAQRRAAEHALEDLAESYAATVRALATALELRDDQTGGHAARVTRLAIQIAQIVEPELVTDVQVEYGFLLHDVGKIGVPDAILLKPGALTPSELELMRTHTVLGERIIEHIPYLDGVARDVVASHHERWDGGGYPRGLAGEDIPLSARIFAVADSYDAMTNDRPYRKALRHEDALKEIAGGAHGQFDPVVVEAFAAVDAGIPVSTGLCTHRTTPFTSPVRHAPASR